MVSPKSEKPNLRANLKRWLIVNLAVAVPVTAALGGSFLLSSEAFQAQNERTEQLQIQELRAQSRLLLENVWDQIDTLKMKAIAYAKTHKSLDPTIRSFATVPAASATQATRNRVQQAGAEIMSTSGSNQISITFGATEDVTKPGANLIVLKVNPAEVFSRFNRWTTRREAGNLRGYLIDSDGKVLAHSERAFSGSDFSGAEVYQQALKPLFQDKRIAGVATYHAVDLRNVLTAYIRVSGFPLAVVVERVVHPAAASILRPILIPAILLVAVVGLLCLLSMLALQKFFQSASSRIVRAPELDMALEALALAQKQRSLKARLQNQLQDQLARATGELAPAENEPELAPAQNGGSDTAESLLENDPPNV